MDLHYEVRGTGEPIVLIHSGGTDLREWQFVESRLTQHYRVIAVDMRGTGQSPPPLQPANYIEDVRDLLDHLNLDRATLVGHSIGGQVAIDFALTAPERVSNLILLGSGLTGYQYSLDFQQWMNDALAAAPDVTEMVKRSLSSPIYQVVMSSPRRDLMIELMTQNTYRWLEWQSFEAVWAQPPAIERLSELKAKTLCIIGTEDHSDLFCIAELLQQVPDIHFAKIEGADHMPTLTHPDEFVRLVTHFLSESHPCHAPHPRMNEFAAKLGSKS